MIAGRGLIAAVLLCCTAAAQALGLGRLEVHSALDEPLSATIELTDVAAGDLDSLEVALGSRDDFSRAGVTRAEHISGLRFEVGSRDGRPIVSVSTDGPVREPFLHFVVTARWAGGRLVREYTALLDPPLYIATPPPTVSPPVVTPPVMAPPQPEPAVERPMLADPAPAPSERVAPSAPPPVLAPEALGDEHYAEFGPTVRGDTLWAIASELAQHSRYDVFQVMIALQQANPDAFIDNNINRLRTGQILRAPDVATFERISSADARRAYSAQLGEWEAYRQQIAARAPEVSEPAQPAAIPAPAPAPEPVAEVEMPSDVAADDARDDTPATLAPSEPALPGDEQPAVDPDDPDVDEDLLRIVRAALDGPDPDVDGLTDVPATDAAVDATESRALRARLAVAEEALVSRELENRELRERVRLLEEQVQATARLLEIESGELAVVQRQAAERAARQEEEARLAEEFLALEDDDAMAPLEDDAPALPADAAPSPVTPEPTAVEPAAETTQPTPGTQPEPTAETTQPTPATQPEPTEAEAPASEPAAATTRVQRTDSGMAWWQNAWNALLDAGNLLIFGAVGIVLVLIGLLMLVRRRRSLHEFEESILSGGVLSGRSESVRQSRPGTGTDTSFLSDFGVTGMGSVHEDEVDPIAEAEVYLAYGRSEQAEEVLREAIGRQPERQELKLKLLEIYQQRNDLQAFETLAEELYPAVGEADSDLWKQVAEMGRAMNPQNPLFRPVTGTSRPAAVATDGSSPGDATRAVAPAVAAVATAAANKPAQPQARPDTPTPPAASPAAGRDDELPLHLDFDLAEESVTAEPVTPRPTPPAPPASVTAEPSRSTPAVAQSDTASDELSGFEDLELDLDFESMKSDGGSKQAEGDGEESNRQQMPADSFDTVSLAGDDDHMIEFEMPELKLVPSTDGGGDDGADTSGEGDDASGDDPQNRVQWDEAGTKLDLARAYIDMGDADGARSIIEEVMRDGSAAQREQAAELAAQLRA